MQNKLKICFIGDIYGKMGRRVVRKLLPKYIKENDIDFVIANGENLAGGAGITNRTMKQILDAGVDCITSGNHIWRRRDIFDILEEGYPVLRPANYPTEVPGDLFKVFTVKNIKIGVFNLLGRTFLENVDNPFTVGEKIVKLMKKESDIIICDFHAETTSEKMAMGWFLDGDVDAVLGTHTHIQTSDERILNKGTGYITDAGMTGSHDSVIGVRKDIIIERFRTSLPVKFKPGKGDSWFNGVKLEFNDKKLEKITRIQKRGVQL